MNVPTWRYGRPKLHNEFAITSVALGAMGALAVILAVTSNGLLGTGVGNPFVVSALAEYAPRLLLIASAFALAAVVAGALGVKFRFPGARASRGGTFLGLVVLAQTIALGFAWT